MMGHLRERCYEDKRAETGHRSFLGQRTSPGSCGRQGYEYPKAFPFLAGTCFQKSFIAYTLCDCLKWIIENHLASVGAPWDGPSRILIARLAPMIFISSAPGRFYNEY
ncbi:hypothetical protein TNCV_3797991 [Trichonephila clavipes]|nr:hypothetical protein TNCV_3797991 [Trichonephila clavipes]